MKRAKIRWIVVLSVALVFSMACGLLSAVSGGDKDPTEAALTELELKLTRTAEALANAPQEEPTVTQQVLPTRQTQPTSTPRPTSPPIPTDTPAPSNPGLITPYDYYTEFESEAGWYTFHVTSLERPKYDIAYTSKGMDVFIETGDTYIYAIQDDLWYAPDQVVYVEAEVSTTEGPYDNNIGLLCRATSDGWYEFAIRTNGYWDFYRYDAASETYSYLDGGGSWSIQMRHKANTIGLLCDGDEFTVYINGTETKTIIDDTYPEGQTGFSLSTLEYGGSRFVTTYFASINDLSLLD